MPEMPFEIEINLKNENDTINKDEIKLKKESKMASGPPIQMRIYVSNEPLLGSNSRLIKTKGTWV